MVFTAGVVRLVLESSVRPHNALRLVIAWDYKVKITKETNWEGQGYSRYYNNRKKCECLLLEALKIAFSAQHEIWDDQDLYIFSGTIVQVMIPLFRWLCYEDVTTG